MSTGVRPFARFLRTAVPMWVGTIFLVAGSIAAIGSLREWHDARRFEREAVTAEAALVGTSIERAGRDGNSRTRYLVTYRFTPSQGPEIEQTEEVSVERWEAFATRDAVAVRYLRNEPSTARIEAPEPGWIPTVVTAVTASVAALGVLIAWPWWRRALVLVRVQNRGVAAEAMVIDVAPTGTVVNRVPQWRLKYEFRDQRGERHEGVSDDMRPREAAEWRAGDRGAIRYDPNRAVHSVWLGRA